MDDWEVALGRPRSATDQPPGTYRYRGGGRHPIQPVRIIWDGEQWHCLVNGIPVGGSGAIDPETIPFIHHHAPFHPISEREYDALIKAYQDAKPGTPLRNPAQPVNLRTSRPV